jgi:hypothetical protein
LASHPQWVARVFLVKSIYSHSRATAVETVLRAALLAGPGWYGVAAADAPPNPVRWTAAIVSNNAVNQLDRATLEVSGVIDEGWHVYALEQLPHGPTALRVTVDPNDVATIAGPPAGSPAQKEYSASFGLETRYYNRTFAVRLPVHLLAASAGAKPVIPVSVRFQACSDRECLLPRTLHLSVPLNPAPGG